MDRAKFLKNLTSSAVKLVPLTIKGWDEPIYLKPQTMADVKETIAKGETGTVAERMAKDALYLERGLARMLLDQDGNRLFDPKDDKQMVELRTALESSPYKINEQIQEAYAALSEPDASEVTKTEANPLGN